MSRPYRGRYSPGQQGDPSPEPRHRRDRDGHGRRFRVAPGGARVNLLHVPAIVLFFTALWSGPVSMAWGIGGAILWVGAAQLTREGLRAEQEFYARKLARRPALPRKMLASLLLGIGTGAAAMAHGTAPLGAMLYGVIGALLHLVSFGPDPLHDRATPEGVDDFQRDRVARVVERAEAELAAMTTALAPLRQKDLLLRQARFEQAAHEMIAEVEEDPRDLNGVRKYLGVYLTGAREAAEKFADLYRRTEDPAAKSKFEALLDDLQQNFRARTAKMLQDDATDMDIEIEVLRERLLREGIRASAPDEEPETVNDEVR